MCRLCATVISVDNLDTLDRLWPSFDSVTNIVIIVTAVIRVNNLDTLDRLWLSYDSVTNIVITVTAVIRVNNPGTFGRLQCGFSWYVSVDDKSLIVTKTVANILLLGLVSEKYSTALFISTSNIYI